MDELRWTADDQFTTGLDRPILVVAFHGLFDAAGSATSAVEWLAERLDSMQVGDVDPETFFDFTQERPVVEFDEHDVRRIRWASNRVLAVRTPEGQRDLVLVSGIEPHLRWRTFTEALLEAATRSGSRLVVTLGSMSGMTPHTRPPAVTGSSTNSDRRTHHPPVAAVSADPSAKNLVAQAAMHTPCALLQTTAAAGSAAPPVAAPNVKPADA